MFGGGGGGLLLNEGVGWHGVLQLLLILLILFFLSSSLLQLPFILLFLRQRKMATAPTHNILCLRHFLPFSPLLRYSIKYLLITTWPLDNSVAITSLGRLCLWQRSGRLNSCRCLCCLPSDKYSSRASTPMGSDDIRTDFIFTHVIRRLLLALLLVLRCCWRCFFWLHEVVFLWGLGVCRPLWASKYGTLGLIF